MQTSRLLSGLSTTEPKWPPNLYLTSYNVKKTQTPDLTFLLTTPPSERAQNSQANNTAILLVLPFPSSNTTTLGLNLGMTFSIFTSCNLRSNVLEILGTAASSSPRSSQPTNALLKAVLLHILAFLLLQVSMYDITVRVH